MLQRFIHVKRFDENQRISMFDIDLEYPELSCLVDITSIQIGISQESDPQPRGAAIKTLPTYTVMTP